MTKTKAVILFVIFICLAAAVAHYGASLQTKAGDRVTVGVYGPQPAIFSLSKKSGIVTVVVFDPSVYVQVPGGYEWYRLGSAQLLGKIDGKETGIVTRTFESLIGAPVDMVVAPSRAIVETDAPQDGLSWLLARRGQLVPLLGKSITVSGDNFFDRLLAMRVVGVRKDKLLVLDARSIVHDEKGQRRYRQDALDQRLQGYFYDAIKNEVTITVHAPKGKGSGAERLARIIEGSGSKVLSVEYNETPKNEKCVFVGNKQALSAMDALIAHWDCIRKIDERSTIVVDFYPNIELATLYQ